METVLNIFFGLFPVIVIAGILLFIHLSGKDTRRPIDRRQDEKIADLEKRIEKLEKGNK